MKQILLIATLLLSLQITNAQSFPIFEYETDQCFDYFLKEKGLNWEMLENNFLEIANESKLAQPDVHPGVQYQTFLENMSKGSKITLSNKTNYLYNELQEKNISFSSADKFEPASTCFKDYHDKHQKEISKNKDSRYEDIYQLVTVFGRVSNLDAQKVSDRLKVSLQNTDYNNPLYRKMIFFSVFIPALYQANTQTLEIVDTDTDLEFEINMDEIEANEVEKEYQTKDESEIFVTVETMPEFPGGEPELRKYIAQHVKYPVTAMKARKEGKVYVRFVVNKSGHVEQAQVIRGVDPLLDKSALEVINKLPQWKPGTQRGKAVAVWYTVPIEFSLN